MGRANVIEEPDASIKFSLYQMKMTDGDYDAQGAYWGCGNRDIGWMYHARGDGPLWMNEMFVRAKTREEAKAAVRLLFENAKFYR